MNRSSRGTSTSKTERGNSIVQDTRLTLFTVNNSYLPHTQCGGRWEGEQKEHSLRNNNQDVFTCGIVKRRRYKAIATLGARR